MTMTPVQLAKDLHRRMGYPLGKAHYRMQMLVNDINGYGGPMRHVRKIAYKVKNLGDVMTRRKAAQEYTKDLKPSIAARVKELRKNGFAYFTEEVDPQLLAELKSFYDEVLTERSKVATASPSHPFFFSLMDDADYKTDHILLRFVLQESIIKAVSAHFGSVPFLNPMGIQESRHVKIEKKALRASQQWHLDYTTGGDEAVSVWVYFTDVPTVAQGPLTILPVAASRRVKNTFFPGRIEDEQIEQSELAKEVTPIFGPKMTVFLVSTHRCYHMGSRVHEGEKRVVGIFPFYKAADIDEFIKVTTPLPDLQKMVVSHIPA